MDEQEIQKGDEETASRHSAVVVPQDSSLSVGPKDQRVAFAMTPLGETYPTTAESAAVSLAIPTCGDCPFVDHSGAFTPGGAKPICSHKNAVETFAQGITGVVKGFEDRYHWRHRIVDRNAPPPPQCPIRHGQDTKSALRGHNPELSQDSPASGPESVSPESTSSISSTIAEIRELRLAITCLYLAVPKQIADDVKAKAEAVVSIIDSLQAERKECRGDLLAADPLKGGHQFLIGHLRRRNKQVATEAASNMKAELIKRVKDQAQVYRRGIGPELSDECKRELKWQAIALDELATELEAVELSQDSSARNGDSVRTEAGSVPHFSDNDLKLLRSIRDHFDDISEAVEDSPHTSIFANQHLEPLERLIKKVENHERSS